MNGLSLGCIEGGTFTLCVDKSSGTVAAEVSPLKLGSYRTCFYSNYQTFGHRLFATSYECSDDKQIRLEAKLSELVFHPELDNALFTPLEGAKESAHCPGATHHPTLIRRTEIVAPSGKHGLNIVLLDMLVGVDGRPHDLKVIDSAGPDLDRTALDAVRQWKFKPGTCDGEPMELEIAVEVDFHL
ncbi:MAG: energy transducer TonB [Candidatus Sulfotelmatobacter sp.]